MLLSVGSSISNFSSNSFVTEPLIDPNYKLTSDYDPKNAFDIEKFLNHRLKLKADDVYDIVNVDEDEV